MYLTMNTQFEQITSPSNSSNEQHQIPLTNPAECDRILSASQKNNPKEIIRLVNEDNVSVNHTNSGGQTALHIASVWGHLETVQTLLSLSASPDMQNKISGATPLHCTIQSSKGKLVRRLECAKLLLNEGNANPDKPDLLGITPLGYLKNSNRMAMIQNMRPKPSNDTEVLNDIEFDDYLREMEILLTSKQKPRNEIFDYVEQTNLEKIEMLLNDDDEKYIILEEYDYQSGLTPLLFSIDLVLAMIQDKNKNNINRMKVQALVDIIKLLLKYGSNPNTVQKNINHQNKQNIIYGDSNNTQIDTPIHKLLTVINSMNLQSYQMSDIDRNEYNEYLQSLKDIAIELLRHGAIISETTILIMHDAARRGNVKTIELFVQHLGVDPNTRGRQGLTPLHFAARSGKIDVVKWLLTYQPETTSNFERATVKDGVSVDIQILDDNGKTAYEAAVANGKDDVAQLIKSSV